MSEESEFKLEEKVKKRIKDGWIRTWMMIEVLAVTEEAAKTALQKHVEMMDRETARSMIYKKHFKEAQKVEKPIPHIESAYSLVVEIEMVAQDFETLAYLVMNYAPSAVEILEPDTVKMDVGEAQGILNSLAEMVHKFAAAGVGGIIVKT
ncbi:MAG: hypothetical protein HY367_01330 [Candidatus Aenigmarchaeota archaeon]|nr:hypothetical protein [Candidatus Aenigmarchaeota archaeon]